MPEFSGLLYGRQATSPQIGTGTGPHAIPLEDRAGNSTTLTPANGTDYLVLVYASQRNLGTGNYSEVRLRLGTTAYSIGRSTLRFAAAEAVAASGAPLCGVLVLTGNGSDTLNLQASTNGGDVHVTDAEILAIPLSSFPTNAVYYQQTANSDTIVTTPTAGGGWQSIGTDLDFTPAANGDFLCISTVESVAAGTAVAGNEHAVRQTFEGSEVGQANFLEMSTVPTLDIQNFRMLHLATGLTVAGGPYTVGLQMNGTNSAGNIGARRIRHVAIRTDSFSFFQAVSSTSGLNANNGIGVRADVPGMALTVTDPGAALLHSYLADLDIQINNWFVTHITRDNVQVDVIGFMRGVDDNGATTADDYNNVPIQLSEELASGASYSIEVQGHWLAGGLNTVARNRGNTANVPNYLYAIRWEPAASGGSTQELEGTTTGTSSTSGNLTQIVDFRSSVLIGASSAEGPLLSTTEFEGSTTGVSNASADLTISGFEDLVGTATGVSTASGVLSILAAGAPWNDEQQGSLVYKEISQSCDMRARLWVLNAAGNGLPTQIGEQIAFIAVHDEDRDTFLNYLHLGIGVFDGNYRLLWKSTENSVSNTSSIALSLVGGQLAADVRIVRILEDPQLFRLLTKEPTTPLESNDGWTAIAEIRRSVPLPIISQWGTGCYSDQNSPDISTRIDSVLFSTPT